MAKNEPNVDQVIPKARVLNKLSKLGYKDEKSLQNINENIVFLSNFSNAEKKIVVEIKIAVKNNMLYSYIIGTYSPFQDKKEVAKWVTPCED